MNETASHIGERISDTLGQAAALGRTASKKFDEARRGTADALSGSASSVRDCGEAVDEMAERAAAKLDSTAKYVRTHDSGDMLVDIRQIIRRHPASFVTGACAAGFLFGFAVRRKLNG